VVPVKTNASVPVTGSIIEMAMFSSFRPPAEATIDKSTHSSSRAPSTPAACTVAEAAGAAANSGKRSSAPVAGLQAPALTSSSNGPVTVSESAVVVYGFIDDVPNFYFSCVSTDDRLYVIKHDSFGFIVWF